MEEDAKNVGGTIRCVTTQLTYGAVAETSDLIEQLASASVLEIELGTALITTKERPTMGVFKYMKDVASGRMGASARLGENTVGIMQRAEAYKSDPPLYGFLRTLTVHVHLLTSLMLYGVRNNDVPDSDKVFGFYRQHALRATNEEVMAFMRRVGMHFWISWTQTLNGVVPADMELDPEYGQAMTVAFDFSERDHACLRELEESFGDENESYLVRLQSMLRGTLSQEGYPEDSIAEFQEIAFVSEAAVGFAQEMLAKTELG